MDRVLQIAATVFCAALIMIILGPWTLYFFSLAKIDGRPSYASNSAYTAQDAEALWRKLRQPLPMQVEPLSPYSYLWALLHGDEPPRGTGLAWLVASSHNTGHLKDLDWWHPSGTALTIWLTRNWTTDELIAKGIELETRPGKRTSNHSLTATPLGASFPYPPQIRSAILLRIRERAGRIRAG
jgi:hypothetical protein